MGSSDCDLVEVEAVADESMRWPRSAARLLCASFVLPVRVADWARDVVTWRLRLSSTLVVAMASSGVIAVLLAAAPLGAWRTSCKLLAMTSVDRQASIPLDLGHSSCVSLRLSRTAALRRLAQLLLCNNSCRGLDKGVKSCKD